MSTHLKLTDTQRVVLAAAGARSSSLILPLPKALAGNKAASARVLQSLIEKKLVEERLAAAGEEVWKNEADGRTTLQITTAGLAAIGIDGPAESEPSRSSKARPHPKAKSPGKTKSKSAPRSKAPTSVSEPKPSSKLGQLIAALRGKKGSTIDELTKSTGWQAHSVRGAISGALKKKLGLEVTSESIDGRGRVYRIAG